MTKYTTIKQHKSPNGNLREVGSVKTLTTNTGEELMRRAEGERVQPTESVAGYMTGLTKSGERLSHSQRVGNNKAIDTMKQHITNVTAERVVAEYRSLLGNLLDESSFGEYVKSFHHAKIEQWLTTTLTQLAKDAAAEERERMFAIIDAEAIRTPEGD